MTAQPLEKLSSDVRAVLALHESGHALIKRLLGFSCAGVTIIGGAEHAGLAWGDPDFDPATFSLEDEQQDVERFCSSARALFPRDGERRDSAARLFARARETTLVYLAGQAAERVMLGALFASRPFASADHEAARRYAELICFSEAAVDQFLAYCEQEVEGLLTRYWSSVNAIAAALLEKGTLNGEQIDEAIRNGVASDQRVQDLELRAPRCMFGSP